MKTYIKSLLIICLSVTSHFSQNIYNSSDVKLKAPLKQNWVYKADNIILNQSIVEKVCYLNTLGGIAAVSLVDGKELWKYSYPQKPTIPSVVTFSDKFAIYLTYNYDEKTEIGLSTLTLIDLATGQEKWSQKSQEIWYKPTPFLDDKNVYCIAGPPDDWEENKNYFKMELDKATLFAFSIADGNIMWQQDLWDDESELIQLEEGYLFTIHDFDVSDSGKPKNKLSCFSTLDGVELWKYNPSGMITKAFIGDIKVVDNIVYACPSQGTLNSISAIELTSGEEKWQRDYIATDGFYFFNDTLFTFGNNASAETMTATAWWAFELVEGEKVFTKYLHSSVDIGTLLGKTLSGSILGFYFYTLPSAIVSIFTPSKIELGIDLIQTRNLFVGFFNSSILNDKGIMCVHSIEDTSYFSVLNAKINDESKNEFKYPQKLEDICLANGTSATSAFITYSGKVASINISNCEQEWIQEFEPNSTSLGLIIKDNKMYLFTSKSVFQLQNE